MYTVEATDSTGTNTQTRQYADKEKALEVAESAWETYGASVTVYGPDGSIYVEYEV